MRSLSITLILQHAQVCLVSILMLCDVGGEGAGLAGKQHSCHLIYSALEQQEQHQERWTLPSGQAARCNFKVICYSR